MSYHGKSPLSGLLKNLSEDTRGSEEGTTDTGLNI